ncbi:serine-protein kinase ATM [Vairimorpha necatrix]|uniref:Serine-protein kinase ATM n=1 Tax=Vairimorpha necatrix TaxID=6039 RepID=A0AAX4JGM9_9MICR
MFDSVHKINLYKSKINPSNYLEILTESLNQVVSTDLLNTTLEYLLDDRDLLSIDKFLLLCLKNLKTNIYFEQVFCKSNYQKLLNIPINYNIYIKFNQIIEIIKKPVLVRNESFYNYVLYKKFSNNHKLDKFYEVRELSTVECTIYTEFLLFIYEYNASDEEFVCHANKLQVCINEKSINKETFCINNEKNLKEILISINHNPEDHFYKELEKFDFANNPKDEECLISFIKTLVTKDIYSFGKVILIYQNIKATRKLNFAYFAYLYLTYVKYSSKYIKDRILNIILRTDFSDIIDMIIEFYLAQNVPTSDLDDYFANLNEFMEFNYKSYIHIIYPLLYFKYNIRIDKYDHYIKVHYILKDKENIKGHENNFDGSIGYKEISLCLLYGHFDLKKYKQLIRFDINNILNIIRHEYINKNCKVCIFEILKYMVLALDIKISENVWKYFKAIGCIICKEECEELKLNRKNSMLEKCNKNAFTNFKELLKYPENEVELIKRFIEKFENDQDFKLTIQRIYNDLPNSILDIIGYIKIEEKMKSPNKIKICSNPLDYFKEICIDNLRITNYELYSEAMDSLFNNVVSKKELKPVDDLVILNTKKYRTFLELLNDYLVYHLTNQEDTICNIPDIFKYTELFSTKILEFTTYNMLAHMNKDLIKNLFTKIILDKINHKILRFILEVNFVFKLDIDDDLLIEVCKVVDDFYYTIYLVEQKLLADKNESNFDLLQETYYKIKDYDRVQGISSMFIRPSKTNLFYEFRIDKEKENNEHEILEQFKVIEEDLGEWKNINIDDNVSRHFSMDCKIVEEDIKNLEIVTKRRQLSKDYRLIRLHELLYKSLEYKYNKPGDKINFDLIEDSLEKVENKIENNLVKINLEVLNEFYVEIKRDHISQYINDKKYEKAIEIIYSLFERKEWSFYFELGEIYFLMGNKSKSKESFKKILGIFTKDDPVYDKALIKYLELVNSKEMFSRNISNIKNNSRVWFLYGKLTDNIDYLMNSLLIDGEYKYECIPRIFHILSTTNEKKFLTKSFKSVSRLLDQPCLMSLLVPFFSQILCKINNKSMKIFINDVVISLMNIYKEVYWSALYFIDEINTDKLDIEKKIYLNKIKKMRDVLYDISKSKDIKNLKKDFPDILNCLGLHVPNKYPVIIKDIENDVLIYRSLQAPKRICFLGDDGKKYYYLCKYKDDLRKDSRFIEVCRLINKLYEDSTKYYIRTYEVIPCFYNFGLIEYIDNLVSLKTIATQYYDNINLVARKYSTKKKIGMKDFSSVVASFKPFMDKFLRLNVSDPYQWYRIRDNYIKTCGVINIVGWFMGLGDRHTENILLDRSTFDMVHVDLNCIFDKGKSCSIPELVPFRLTQNILDGFGALGVHGTYTSACVRTLDLLQSNRSIILTNLLSFVYDPLHEWNKKESTGKKIVDGLSNKIENGDVLSKIEDLNEEAMDQSNLCQMYIGWLSFI